jgi:hypothetical protein
MCGTALERRSKLQPNGYFSDRQGAEPVLKQEFSAPDAAVGVMEAAAASMTSEARAAVPETWERPMSVERPLASPVQAAPVVERVPATATPVVVPVTSPAVEPQRRLVQEPVFTGATSVLGLSGGMAPLQMSGAADGDGSYLLAPEAQRTVSWRLWALLLILAGLGFLGWNQWYASHYHRRPDLAKILEMGGKASAPDAPTDQEQPTTDPAKTGTADDAAKAMDAQQQGMNPTADGTAAAATTGQANGAGQQPSSAQNQPTQSQPTQSQPAQNPSTNPTAQQPAQNTGDAGKSPTSQPPAQPQAGQRSTDAKAKPNEASTAEPTEKQPPKKVADAAPDPNYLRDPMLLRAQQYIHGHPQNCDMGLNYLKASAESNPAARIQMAALYQSGVCVPVDRAQAYHWFSLAQQLDPHNMWLEKSRSQLWANMTDAERAKAQ